MGSNEVAVYRWATWQEGEPTLMERGLQALGRLGGAGQTAALEVFLERQDGARRVVAQHTVHTARPDRGQGAARGLLGRVLQRLDPEFEGRIEVSWRRGEHRQAEPLVVRVGDHGVRMVDVWRTLALDYRARTQEQSAAMLHMFDGASSVIRAAGDVGEATTGQHARPPERPSPWLELLRHIQGVMATRPSAAPPQPWSSDPVDFDDERPLPESDPFDAWALAGFGVGEE